MELQQITDEAFTIDENASFIDALAAMVVNQTNSLLVTNADGKLVGGLCVSGLLLGISPNYPGGDDATAHLAYETIFNQAVEHTTDKHIKDFMDTDVEPVCGEESLMKATVAAMKQKRAYIPVVDGDNRPIGIIPRKGIRHILTMKLGTG